MSSETPQEQAATTAARTNLDYQTRLSDVALPGLKATLDSLYAQLGNGGLNQDVHQTFQNARSELNQGYGQALNSSQGLIQQQALQSGEVYQPQQIQDTIALQAQGFERQRAQGMRNLQFQEAQAGLGQYNQLMSMLGQGSGAALNMGRGFSSVQAGAIGGMSNQDPWAGALGGAASGASMGGSIGGGWGALIGGVAGGALGYFGSGG